MISYAVKNSKEVKPGDTFFSISGQKCNGNDYIYEAINNGAIKIVVQSDNPVNSDLLFFLDKKQITLTYVDNVYLAFAQQIKAYYGNAFDGMTFIGVTGTKGKTTTCNALFNFLRADGYSAALMSSTYHKINDVVEKAVLTTEMVNTVYAFLKKAKENNVTHIVLEVSAQAFTQYRIYGILFDAFIFTNFSQEHSESYKTQEDYFKAKCQLYNYLKSNAIVLLNQEDVAIVGSVPKDKVNNIIVKTFSSNINDHVAMYYTTQDDSIHMTKAVLYYKNNTFIFNSVWLGVYNIANIACALLVLDELLFLNQQKIIFLLKQAEFFEHIPGRNEKYFLSKNRTVCIDKAHTPNSIQATLLLLRSLTQHLIVVFGCGGEKDTAKRPIIANIIESLADEVYVSSDNPRNESQEKIFFDIAQGFSFIKNIHFLIDRKKAIELAIESAPSESIIVLLGKGEEQYQQIKNNYCYFSEKEIIKKYMN